MEYAIMAALAVFIMAVGRFMLWRKPPTSRFYRPHINQDAYESQTGAMMMIMGALFLVIVIVLFVVRHV